MLRPTRSVQPHADHDCGRGRQAECLVRDVRGLGRQQEVQRDAGQADDKRHEPCPCPDQALRAFGGHQTPLDERLLVRTSHRTAWNCTMGQMDHADRRRSSATACAAGGGRDPQRRACAAEESGRLAQACASTASIRARRSP